MYYLKNFILKKWSIFNLDFIVSYKCKCEIKIIPTRNPENRIPQFSTKWFADVAIIAKDINISRSSILHIITTYYYVLYARCLVQRDGMCFCKRERKKLWNHREWFSRFQSSCISVIEIECAKKRWSMHFDKYFPSRLHWLCLIKKRILERGNASLDRRLACRDNFCVEWIYRKLTIDSNWLKNIKLWLRQIFHILLLRELKDIFTFRFLIVGIY